MSYRNLEIWKLAREISIETHRMTLTHLPKFERFESGSQIRRASKSIRANIVEGYGRRRYKAEYLKHLTYAQASCDETTDYLEHFPKRVRLPTPPFSSQSRASFRYSVRS